MVLDISFDFFDHIFNKGRTDEQGKTIPTRFQTTEYSLDTIFIVSFIMLVILTFLVKRFRNYLKKHYQRKYEKQNAIPLQNIRDTRNIGNMYLA